MDTIYYDSVIAEQIVKSLIAGLVPGSEPEPVFGAIGMRVGTLAKHSFFTCSTRAVVFWVREGVERYASALIICCEHCGRVAHSPGDKCSEDDRQTGKTTRVLLRALAVASEEKSLVIVVEPTPKMARVVFELLCRFAEPIRGCERISDNRLKLPNQSVIEVVAKGQCVAGFGDHVFYDMCHP